MIGRTFSEKLVRSMVKAGRLSAYEGPWLRHICLGQRSVGGKRLWGLAYRRGTWATTSVSMALCSSPDYYDYCSKVELVRMRMGLPPA